MGKVWVRLLTVKTLPDVHNHFVIHQAGEWVEVKKQQAQLWLASGQAEILRNDIRAKVVSLASCGVLITGGNAGEGEKLIRSRYGDEIGVQAGEPSLPYPQTLIWDTRTPLRTELMMVGFHRLTSGWQVAAPLWRYRKLANGIGAPEEQQITREIVHDLRIPVYDPGLVYVRRCPQTQELIDQWMDERTRGDNDKLAFLRALYLTKPIICALPVTWLVGERMGGPPNA